MSVFLSGALLSVSLFVTFNRFPAIAPILPRRYSVCRVDFSDPKGASLHALYLVPSLRMLSCRLSFPLHPLFPPSTCSNSFFLHLDYGMPYAVTFHLFYAVCSKVACLKLDSKKCYPCHRMSPSPIHPRTLLPIEGPCFSLSRHPSSNTPLYFCTSPLSLRIIIISRPRSHI